MIKKLDLISNVKDSTNTCINASKDDLKYTKTPTNKQTNTQTKKQTTFLKNIKTYNMALRNTDRK